MEHEIKDPGGGQLQMGEFNVFIAWSGEVSREVAKTWHDWLPLAIQSARPWMSESDIDKGKPWFGELAKQLKGIRVGIICVTPDNLKSPSIHFEAGALSKTVVDEAFVCPYLFHVKDSDLGFPLAHFQTTKMGRDDSRRLFHTLNRALDATLTEDQLSRTFDKWWAELDSRLNMIALPTGAEREPRRTDRDILEELLELTRNQARERLSRAEVLEIGNRMLGLGSLVSAPSAPGAPIPVFTQELTLPYPQSVSVGPPRIRTGPRYVLRRRRPRGTGKKEG